MVCTGNICRSAMAQVVLADRLAAAELGSDVIVTSSGISDEEHGRPIDPRALRLLRERGYGQGDDDAARAADRVMSGHRAHRITDAEIVDHDLLLAMTDAHRRELVRRAQLTGADDGRVRMFRAWDPEAPAGADGRELDVPDPWYGTMADFVDTLDVVERVCDALVPVLAQLRLNRPASPASR
ncbi:low molecular weight protein-tyrosine-phosphatase [Actinomyces respiraculi]|uniref:protein-tyrosine-phosphatase n=2 Tax=Actinomyces TaxID=1654 RepID=A0A7T0LNI8_9ACTO|nr:MULTISPECIES: low molecular weight protein-tyrosine-phosphatase [Actinomyces]QPL06718.1 low molecular weight phosphotyrosine protein phosphatase [Actinomyces respiraculi]